LTEANARLARFGRNHLPRVRRAPWWIKLRSNFIHLFAILLWIAALLPNAGNPKRIIVSDAQRLASAVQTNPARWQESQLSYRWHTIPRVLTVRCTVDARSRRQTRRSECLAIGRTTCLRTQILMSVSRLCAGHRQVQASVQGFGGFVVVLDLLTSDKAIPQEPRILARGLADLAPAPQAG
jgi:hypothetical protein